MKVLIAEKRLAGRTVLRDVAFELERGETLGVLGPSGIGKTTLLRLIAGLDRDFCGRVEGVGRVGMVFQEPTLLAWRTARQNVAIASGIDEAEADELLESVGLAGREDAYPGALSLGQARRVALARAFAVRPDTLLLDEPFVSLDAGAAARMEQVLLRLMRTYSVRTILVTHNAQECARLGDRVMTLDGVPAGIAIDAVLDRPREERDAEWLRLTLARLGAS